MFERDAQQPLEHFLMDHVSEEDFLKVARPWPRYATDYKPLVEYAMSKDWPVLAANVPGRCVRVSKSGFGVLDGKSDRKRNGSRRSASVQPAATTTSGSRSR